ncbi:MAG: SPOR domain-containing protein [Magnetococcales bacterium]|nr:SPOR domain-containing protein [Magnetococcales bacterium]
MKQEYRWTSKGMAVVVPLLLFGACAPHHHVDPVTDSISATYQNTEFLIKQDTGSYCKAGEVWGGRLRDQQGALYGEKRTDNEFVSFLRTGDSPSTQLKSEVGRFYFGVTDGLREKFNSCFTTSYNRMDAEKVLGSHIARAAYDMGAEVGENLAKWPVEFFSSNILKSSAHAGRFETFSKEINAHALLQLEYFNELLTVGSPADRQGFKVGFVCRYQKELNDGLAKLYTMGVRSESVPAKEGLVYPVVCDSPSTGSMVLRYSRVDEAEQAAMPGMIYANHALFAKDSDDLGFRVFTGEELYLRFYRRALQESGSSLGKKLYHGLMKRSDGVEYLRNLALAVEKQSDIKDFFNPGFLESFAHNGTGYLRDLQRDAGLAHASVSQKPPHPGQGSKKTSQVTEQAPVHVAAQEDLISEPTPQSATAQLHPEGGNCFVQVGVFADSENVQAKKAQLEQLKVLNILVDEIALKQGNAKASRVRVGPFASRTEADSQLSHISKNFSGSFATCL